MIWDLDHGVVFNIDKMMLRVGNWLSWLMSLSWVWGFGVCARVKFFLYQAVAAIFVDQCCEWLSWLMSLSWVWGMGCVCVKFFLYQAVVAIFVDQCCDFRTRIL